MTDRNKSVIQIILVALLTIALIGIIFGVDYLKRKEELELVNRDYEIGNSQKPIDYPIEKEVENDAQLPDLSGYDEGDEIEDLDYELKEGGWVPAWDFNAGLSSLTSHPSHFHTISPVWYSVESDGSLISRKTSNSSSLQTFASQNNIEVIPTIGIFDSELMKSVLSDPVSYQKHLDSIVHEVLSNEYTGIDLDYESIELTEKEEYLNLIKDLSSQLHARDKKLSVTVLSKWSDLDVYTSFSQTRQVQDWSYISQYADQIKIMAYDYTTTASDQPGPIGPFDWQIKILNYAVKKIPREKIWLGVHLYGYEWSDGGKRAASTYQDYLDKISVIPPTEDRFLDVYMEGYAKYPCYVEDSCTLYYMTPEGVEARKNLATSYKIAGVFYWRIGRESELIY